MNEGTEHRPMSALEMRARETQADKMRTIELSVLPGFLDDILSGDKTFELRYDDKLYRPGDILRLSDNNSRTIEVRVTYVLSSFELAPGYVALSFKRGRYGA